MSSFGGNEIQRKITNTKHLPLSSAKRNHQNLLNIPKNMLKRHINMLLKYMSQQTKLK